MTYVGIDPGLDGALAEIHDDGFIAIFDTPTLTIQSGKKKKRKYNIAIIADLFHAHYNHEEGKVRVGIESQHSMPAQGVASVFSLGEGYGIWQGLIVAYALPLTYVTPQAWKKALMAGMPKEKDASVLRASQLFPKIANQLVTPRGRKLHGRADALLIAYYLKNLLEGDAK